MIKKLIYLIAILFLIVPNAMAFMGPAVGGGGMPPSAGAECSDCSGAERLYIHFENYADITDDTDLPCGCTDGTTTALTAVGSPTISGAQYKDGNESLLINAVSEHYYIDGNQSTNYLVNMANDEIEFWIRVTSFTNFGRILIIDGLSDQASNNMYLRLDDVGGYIAFYYRFEGNDVYSSDCYFITDVPTDSDTGWMRVTLGWSTERGLDQELYIAVDTDDDGTNDFAEEDGTVGSWEAGDLANYRIIFGTTHATTAHGSYYIDRFHVKGAADTDNWGVLP